MSTARGRRAVPRCPTCARGRRGPLSEPAQVGRDASWLRAVSLRQGPWPPETAATPRPPPRRDREVWLFSELARSGRRASRLLRSARDTGPRLPEQRHGLGPPSRSAGGVVVQGHRQVGQVGVAVERGQLAKQIHGLLRQRQRLGPPSRLCELVGAVVDQLARSGTERAAVEDGQPRRSSTAFRVALRACWRR